LDAFLGCSGRLMVEDEAGILVRFQTKAETGAGVEVGVGAEVGVGVGVVVVVVVGTGVVDSVVVRCSQLQQVVQLAMVGWSPTICTGLGSSVLPNTWIQVGIHHRSIRLPSCKHDGLSHWRSIYHQV